jgi:hypothetical protein
VERKLARDGVVPCAPEQWPINEYEALAASLPFSYAAGDLRLYYSSAHQSSGS